MSDQKYPFKTVVDENFARKSMSIVLHQHTPLDDLSERIQKFVQCCERANKPLRLTIFVETTELGTQIKDTVKQALNNYSRYGFFMSCALNPTPEIGLKKTISSSEPMNFLVLTDQFEKRPLRPQL